ncbi:MAG: hypothetical protein F4Z14_07265 [Gammaproteobacteria bacterium]|nr:hypothetical protein [Gammaproteobacteria bacterium]
MKTAKQCQDLTLKGMLVVALTFLIIHPGMFATTEAQSFEGIYLQEPIVSIAPDLEGEDYGLHPFYVGRPLYADMIWLNAGHLVGILIGLGITISPFLARKLGDFWDHLQNHQDRVKVTTWLQTTGYLQLIGIEECKNKTGRGQEYDDCIGERVINFTEAFVKQANKCAVEPPRSRRVILERSGVEVPVAWYAKFEPGLNLYNSKIWSCVFIDEVWDEDWIVSVTYYDVIWTWDASPWLR